MLLEVSSLTTAYDGLIAISDISVTVAEGEIVVVAGANGAGKSTLLKTICGMEKARSGTVSFAGETISGLPGHEITKRGVAYVPDDERRLPRLSVPDALGRGRCLQRANADGAPTGAATMRLARRSGARMILAAGALEIVGSER